MGDAPFRHGGFGLRTCPRCCRPTFDDGVCKPACEAEGLRLRFAGISPRANVALQWLTHRIAQHGLETGGGG